MKIVVLYSLEISKHVWPTYGLRLKAYCASPPDNEKVWSEGTRYLHKLGQIKELFLVCENSLNLSSLRVQG